MKKRLNEDRSLDVIPKSKRPAAKLVHPIRLERHRQGITLDRLAELTGISKSDLSAIENSKRPLFPGWRDRIAQALGVESGVLDQTVKEKRHEH